MKKKLLALLLACTMALEPVSVAAAEFTDGQRETEVFRAPEEVEQEEVDREEAANAGEVLKAVEDGSNTPAEEKVQIGDDVWVTFDDEAQTAVISGTGPTWDYLDDGTAVPDSSLKNPFLTKRFSKIIIENGVTRIGNRLFSTWHDISDNPQMATIDEIEISDTVNSIGDYAFADVEGLKELEIPGSVKKIGEHSFDAIGSLNKVTLNHGLEEIGSYAFSFTAIDYIALPDTVLKLGEGVFWDCRNLKEIDGFEQIEVIPDYLFAGCPIENFNFENVREIGERAFSDSKLTKLNFSDKLEIIKGSAFFGCNGLTTVSLPNSVTEIGAEAFRECKYLKNIKLSESLKQIEVYTFYECLNLKEIVIPKSVSNIEEGAFGLCSRLNKVTFLGNPEFPLEDNDDTYSKDPFNDCPLTEIVGYSNTHAEQYANYRGIKFTSLGNMPVQIKVGDHITATIEGDTLTLSGSGATYDYTHEIDWYEGDKSNIKNIVFDGEITDLGDHLLGGFNNLVNIDIPNSVLTIGSGTFSGCTVLRRIVIPNSVTEIGEYAFSYCYELEHIILPNRLNRISEGTFYLCTNLKTVEIPESVQKIEKSAFSETGLEIFDWPENVSVIEGGTFSTCDSLKEVSISDSVAEVHNQAFLDCTALEKISIPKSVTYFGDDVFYGCRNLTIYGFRDSAAERYANANNIPFISADYKVVFKDKGRTVKTEYVLAGDNATPPTLTPRPGYTLSWDADYTAIQEDMIINAVWTKEGEEKPDPPIIVYPPETTKYVVTFKDRGVVVKTEKVPAGEAADYPYLYRYGYKLSWDKDFSKVTSNITVNAVWTVITPKKVTSLSAELLAKYVRLSWDRAEYTDYYLVYRKAAADKTYTQIAKTTKVLWTDKKAKPGVEYQYKVAAVSALEGKKHQGEYSDIVSAKLGIPETGKIYTSGKLNYKVMNSKEVRVTGLAKVSGSVNIPNTVTICGKVFKVTSIDHKAFYKNADIINVKIGNNVNYVGQYSFYQCPNLETVKFGSRVEIISTCAFTQCPKLESVVLPSSVERLGAKVFYQCKKMKVLTMKTSKLEYLGKKGLAIHAKAVIKVPAAKYNTYRNMITKSGKYSGMKIQKM